MSAAAVGRYKFHFIKNPNIEAQHVTSPTPAFTLSVFTLLRWNGEALSSLRFFVNALRWKGLTVMTNGKNNSWRYDHTFIWMTCSPRPHFCWGSGGSDKFSHVPKVIKLGVSLNLDPFPKPDFFSIQTYDMIGWVSGTVRFVCGKFVGKCSWESLP